MACNLFAFLREKGGSATTEEIAAELLKMPNAPLAGVDSLVQSMCADQEIQQTAPHVWEICSECSEEHTSDGWILLTTVPASCHHWSSLQAVLMAEMDGIQCVERHIISRAQGLAEQDWLQLSNIFGDRLVMIEGLANQTFTVKSGLKSFARKEPLIISLLKVVRNLIADQPVRTSNEMAQILKAECYEWPEPEKQLDQLIQNAQACLDILNVNHPDRLLPLLAESRKEFAFDRFAFNRDDVNAVPALPGIYLMKDARQKVIYVGKAKNLARRLMSYFVPGMQRNEKMQAIHQQLVDFEFESLGSELEALLKEWETIQKYDPPINRQVNVHQRSHRQAERYERILFLPAKDPRDVQIYFLHPTGGFTQCLYHNERQMTQLTSCVRDVFFKPLPVSKQDKTRCEICWSWLSETKSSGHSLDMRGITLESEALRLINDHINSFRSDTERVIQT